jgi:hypothetical protein
MGQLVPLHRGTARKRRGASFVGADAMRGAPQSRGAGHRGERRAGAPRATDTASSASSQFAPFTVSRAGDAAAPATGLTLRFTSRARIYATLPAAAAADGGGTVVAVHGRDFRDGMSGSARCAFGTITVTAAIQNSTRVECVAPTHAEATVSFAFTAHAQRLLGAQERLEFSFV